MLITDGMNLTDHGMDLTDMDRWIGISHAIDGISLLVSTSIGEQGAIANSSYCECQHFCNHCIEGCACICRLNNRTCGRSSFCGMMCTIHS